MSDSGRGDSSVLQKIQVSCDACGVSDSFYSNVSVEQFKARHRGHEVVGGSGQGTASATSAEEAPPSVYSVKPPPKEELPLQRNAGTKLPKVIVDTVVFPVLPEPVFRLRGFKEDMEEAFTTTIRSEHAAKVRDILLRGEFIDHDYSGLRYFWEPDSVEYEGNVSVSLGLPPRVTETGAAEPIRESRQSVEEPETLTVARTNEILFGDPKNLQRREGGNEPGSIARPEPAVELEALESPPRPPTSRVAEESRGPEPAASAPRRPSIQAKAEEKLAEGTSAGAPAQSSEDKEGDYLLVSKSWYIQGGSANKEEAIRISKVLKAFRWRVEPAYTIGVILDDMLSIETSRTQISRSLIHRVEGAGYRLTAVTAEQGKPVAWFKRSETDAPSERAGSDPLDEELEPEVTG